MDGPALVIAGAGSGKTRVLTYKIAYLLEQGMKASHILALTFTNKAAREMKDRIGHIVGAEMARYLWMGTFHSIAAKILRQEAELLGFTKDFTIYDTTDSKSVIKAIVKDMKLDDKIYKPNMVYGRISDAKNVLVSPQMYAENRDYQKRDRYDRLYQMSDIYREYQNRLRAANSMDFDDLLVNICVLFRDHKDRLAHYQQMFEYILVDEYQDTNYAQYLIVKQLSEPQNLVCVVGDDAQSIYSFRGADIRNILTFQNGYGNARLFKLERNYRSTQTIVGAANSLIHHNRGQIYKEVYSEKQTGDPIQLRSFVSDRDEAEGVVLDIIKHLPKYSKPAESPLAHSGADGERGRGLGAFCILYRTNAQSRAFENELRKHGLAYRIYGGMSFYQRKEIKDAIAYFRLAVNPKDWEALTRAINNPSRKIGEVTIRKIREEGLEAVAHSNKNVVSFVLFMFQLQSDMDTLDAYNFAQEVLNQSGLMAAAATDLTPEGIDRKQNLDELLTGIREFVAHREEQGIDFTPITDFLSEVSLLTDQDEHTDDNTPRVTLMTVHAAKGLEFPEVYVVGMEENLFPSQMCSSESEIEEERRLLYVAITRAMERCTLTYAGQRFRNGSLNFSSPSRFLRDIDARYISKGPSASSGASGFSGFSGHSGHSGASGHSGYSGFSGGFVPESSHTDVVSSKRLIPISKSMSSASSSESSHTSLPHSTQGVRTGEGCPQGGEGAFAQGARVFHKVFGAGTVLSVYNENDNDKIDILFDKVGI